MKKMFFSIIVVLLSVVSFTSCSGEELVQEAMAVMPKPDPTPDANPTLWEYTGTKLVKNETSLQKGIVNFLISFEDSYKAVYEGEVLDSTAVREYSFADSKGEEFRSLDISLSKGYSVKQKEFTNHVNLRMNRFIHRDTIVVSMGGWNVTRAAREVHFNFKSTSNPDDGFDPVATDRSFFGTFKDPEGKYEGEIELSPVKVKLTFNNVMSHHKDLSYRYDSGSAKWLDRPWETENDFPSPLAIEIKGKYLMRYAFVTAVTFAVAEFSFSDTLFSEYEWWVPFNRDEALSEGSQVM